MLRMLSILTLVCANFFSCSWKTSSYEKTINKSIFEFAAKMKKQDNLILSSEGGEMMGNIKSYNLSFEYANPLTIDEGRVLIIRICQQFIDSINASSQIRPYLANYPFTDKNLRMSVLFGKNGRFRPENRGISAVIMNKGKLDYCVYNPEKHNLETVLLETYEEAAQRAARFTPSTP